SSLFLRCCLDGLGCSGLARFFGRDPLSYFSLTASCTRPEGTQQLTPAQPVRLQQWSSARPATSPLSSAHAPGAAMKRIGKHFGFVPLADTCTAIYKVNGNLPDQLVGGRHTLERKGHGPSMNFRALWLGRNRYARIWSR